MHQTHFTREFLSLVKSNDSVRVNIRFHHYIVTCSVTVGTSLTVPSDTGVDYTGIYSRDRFIVQTILLQCSW